jgi:large subunit ribosomal protein L7/L12
VDENNAPATPAETNGTTPEKGSEEEEMTDTAKMDQLISTIENMTVLEVSELVKKLEDKFGVTAAAPMMMGAMPGAGAAAAAVEEKTEFDVILVSAGDKKLQVIKEIRAITNLGLKESKDLVEGAPKVVKEKVAKAEADKLKAQIEEAGGVVEIK